MAKMVQCVVLGREAEGLDKPPHPGLLGGQIYENVSKEGWGQWLMRLQMIINENQLTTAMPSNIELIEKYMAGFLFGREEAG
uniref:Fe-S cluster biosynthesis and repair protein YggX n=1 Tax=Candidatus Kentrum sp. LPFa TaxID=2126335 RepID=A0A450X456_9GAMM|nr:MAG: Fe-S cluster biosynthesis and repair protein YggX [Candidatus Kentron sp. LPFa]VFK35691.1 MAG: Fe-S cluster biosynthesis and repair protein YggX [Candidatus Kentron sp. LPFa]